jgi:hypothetical protein
MKVSRAAAKLNQVIHARTLPNWVLAAAIIGAAVVYLAMASHVRGAAIPIEQMRSTRDVPNMPAIIGAAHWGAGPGSAGPLAAWPVFRFGFLEFEADLDAPVE